MSYKVLPPLNSVGQASSKCPTPLHRRRAPSERFVGRLPENRSVSQADGSSVVVLGGWPKMTASPLGTCSKRVSRLSLSSEQGARRGLPRPCRGGPGGSIWSSAARRHVPPYRTWIARSCKTSGLRQSLESPIRVRQRTSPSHHASGLFLRGLAPANLF